MSPLGSRSWDGRSTPYFSGYFGRPFLVIVLAALAALLGAKCSTAPKGKQPLDGGVEPHLEADSGLSNNLSCTTPVVWGVRVDVDDIDMTFFPGGAQVDRLAEVQLVFLNAPNAEEGNAFTLIGGGLDDTGLHGPNATGFVGIGLHFVEHEDGPGDNRVRDEAYEMDYTRTVEGGRIEFTVHYAPTDINQWGARYFPGTEIALTMMRAGTGDRVLHASNNDFNWAIAGVGEGNRAQFLIDLRGSGLQSCKVRP